MDCAMTLGAARFLAKPSGRSEPEIADHSGELEGSTLHSISRCFSLELLSGSFCFSLAPISVFSLTFLQKRMTAFRI